MIYVGSALVVLCGGLLFVAFAVGGLVELIRACRFGRESGSSAFVGVVLLVASALLATVPWLATGMAEASTGWVDRDHDGMLDGFVNGAYDWVDINLGPWLTSAALLVLFIVGLVVVAMIVHMSQEKLRSTRRHGLITTASR